VNRRVDGGAVSVVALSACLLLASAPAHAQTNSVPGPAGIERAAWLAGCWKAASADGRNAVEEQWMSPGGGLMVGMSRTIREGEARGYELVTIRSDAEGHLIYHAEPSGQSPTDFHDRSTEAGRLVFVNGDHDFPKKIVYVRMAKDFVHAAVFAEVDGADPAFLIPYRRTGCPGH